MASIKKAMQTYARQGGTSSIFIHEDGMQVISEELRQERIAFYATHNIGWVARPKHDSSPEGFNRAGRFKKASNMNYGLALSMKLERHLKVLEEAVEQGELEESENQSLEDKALEMAVEETFEETGGKWRPWAANGKSLRIGEIILIVDADTIVPEVRVACMYFHSCLFLTDRWDAGLFTRCCPGTGRVPRSCHHPARIRSAPLLWHLLL